MPANYDTMTRQELIAELRRLQASAPLVDSDLEALNANLLIHQEELRAQTTELVESQRQLELSRDRYVNLFDYAPVVYLTLDPSGIIEGINLTGCALIGWERSRLLGMPFVTRVNPDDRKRFLDHMLRCRAADEDGAPVTSELSLLCDGGKVVPMQLTSREARAEDGVRRVFHSVLTDLTERRRAENETRKSEAARVANEAKDRFLATVSHELRTPLTPVLMAVSALDRSNEVPPGLQPTFDMIRRNVELETRLIDDLLDATRINARKLALQFTEVDAHALLREVADMVAGDAREKGLDLTLDLKSLRHALRADPVRLRQVFWNLLRNAIKYTPRGSVLVTSSDEQDSAWHLTVADTGIGIEPDTLEQIFEPYVQADTVGIATGLGLGLTITRGLVRAHGGSVWAHSAGQGQGAAFHLVIPAIPLAERAAPFAPVVAAPPPRPAAGIRILIVEDNSQIGRMLYRLLEREGHDVTLAATIAEALAQPGPFDLLISDLGLPDGSGLDLMQQIIQRYPVRGIALSGYTAERDVRQCRDAGFAMHLAKPIDFDQLLEAIDHVRTTPAA